MDQKHDPRKLRLNRETVRELTDTELSRVEGAVPPWTPVIWTLPLDHCLVIASGGPKCI